jgi:hypothetical protein
MAEMTQREHDDIILISNEQATLAVKGKSFGAIKAGSRTKSSLSEWRKSSNTSMSGKQCKKEERLKP